VGVSRSVAYSKRLAAAGLRAPFAAGGNG